MLLHSEPILRSLIQSRDIEILRYLADVRIHEKINESAPLSSDASLNDSRKFNTKVALLNGVSVLGSPVSSLYYFE